MKRISAILMALLVASLTFAFPAIGDTSDTTGVSASVQNRAVDVYDITSIPAQDPTESSTTAVTFYCAVNDPDGNADIQTVNATFTYAGEPTRSADCGSGSVINSTAKNYTCTINMQFYGIAGSWNYTCYGYDTLTSDSMASSFTYNDLEAWTMTPTSITFGNVNLGQTDIGATDDPIAMTNTGNHDLTGEIKITALDLKGVTTPSEYIPAENFSTNVADSEGGDVMVNNTAVTITGTSLDRGSSSTEDLFFYLEQVPSSGISYQTYNTAGLGEWTISTA